MHNFENILYIIFEKYYDFVQYDFKSDILYLIEVKDQVGDNPSFRTIEGNFWGEKFLDKNEWFETLTPEQKEVVIWNA